MNGNNGINPYHSSQQYYSTAQGGAHPQQGHSNTTTRPSSTPSMPSQLQNLSHAPARPQTGPGALDPTFRMQFFSRLNMVPTTIEGATTLLENLQYAANHGIITQQNYYARGAALHQHVASNLNPTPQQLRPFTGNFYVDRAQTDISSGMPAAEAIARYGITDHRQVAYLNQVEAEYNQGQHWQSPFAFNI